MVLEEAALRNTKVCQLYFTIYRNDNILRFYISVHNMALMCRLQSKRNLNCNTRCLSYGKFSFS